MLALALFVATLILVIWQPKGLGIGWSALAGAAVALATGVVDWAGVALVWHIVWDATFTFVALIIISLLLDQAGFFSWAALHVTRWGKGRSRLLFLLVAVLGALIAAFFANDGAALLLTPIVVVILVRLDFSPAEALLFIIATGFIADTTSLPLVTSNLVNIVTANYFDVGFGRYAAVMVPIDLVSLAASLVVLWVALGRRLATRHDTTRLDPPASAIKDRWSFAPHFRCWRCCWSRISSRPRSGFPRPSSPGRPRSCSWPSPAAGGGPEGVRPFPSFRHCAVRPGKSCCFRSACTWSCTGSVTRG